MIKVIIVNELNVFSEGLELIINSQEDMHVVEIINEQNSNSEVLSKCKPDVILFHTKLMNTKISTETHTYRKQNPQIRLIYISKGFSKSIFYDAAENKPDGFVTNGLAPEKFVRAIRDIYEQQYIISGEIAMEFLHGIQHIGDLKKLVLKNKLEERNINGTLRDLDVLYLIYLEKNNKEISSILGLPEKSVRYYVSKAYKKLQMKNRSETITLLEELIDY